MSPMCGGCKAAMRRLGEVFVPEGSGLRACDEYQCRQCGQTVFTAFAHEPVDPAYAAEVRTKAPERIRG